jgi:hypothetical protein
MANRRRKHVSRKAREMKSPLGTLRIDDVCCAWYIYFFMVINSSPA